MHFITSAFPFKTQGPHLLAPTGSDLRRYGQEGTVFAGYHYDLNFLTIHGRSRFPGLNIWLRNGQKVEVKVPVGCLLIQTGKQVRVMTNV
jgi:isopenicillin N synthase-like dioxygenase